MDPIDPSNMIESIALLGEDKSELDCHVVADVDLDGERFVLLTPKKTWVSIVRDDEDGVLEVPPEDFTEQLKAAFAAELSSKNLVITVVSGEYLLEGTVSDDFSETCDSMSISDEDDEDSFLILADIEVDYAQYLLLAPEMPAMFAARVRDGKAVALDEKELAKVESHLEEALEARVN